MEIAILFVLISLSAFFSGSETALSKVHLRKIRALEKNEVKNAKILRKILENKDDMLSTILIGNNIVNIGSTAFSTMVIIKFWGESYVSVGMGILTILILIFGEITPKTVSYENALKISLKIAPLMYILIKIFEPVNYFIKSYLKGLKKLLKITEEQSHMTTEEFKSVIQEGYDSKIFDYEDVKMLYGFINWKKKKITEIFYVKKKDIVSVNINDNYNDIVKIISTEGYSRMPVYDGDEVIGILHDVDLLFIEDKENFDIRSVMKKVIFVDINNTVEEVTDKMKNRHNHMAIIKNGNNIVGLSTLEICTEIILGDIKDETDD